MLKKISFLLILIIACGASAVIYVPAEFQSIQSAINAAVEPDTIIVSPGTYYENINLMGKNLVLASEFITASDTSYISQTIIDGRDSTSVVTFNSQESDSTKIIGFTITNGNGTWGDFEYPGFEHNYGGGILCVDASPTISYCSIEYNYAGVDTSFGKGGGIFFKNSTSNLDHCVVKHNRLYGTPNHTIRTGGGILMLSSSITITDSEIKNNVSSFYGGIIARYSHLEMFDCEISGNEAEVRGGGLGLYDDTTYHLKNVLFHDNEAGDDGGGLLIWYNSNGLIENCVFTLNRGNDSGGAVTVNRSSPCFNNCIFYNNSAPSGGVYFGSGYAYSSFMNCVMYENFASNGKVLLGRYSGSDKFYNCIFYGNGQNQFFMIDGNVDIDYCNVEYGVSSISESSMGDPTYNYGQNNIEVNPMFTDETNLDFSLQSSSPCIDTGISDTTIVTLTEFDFLGNPRIFGAEIDMGAIENQGNVSNNEIYAYDIKSLSNYPNPFNPQTEIKFSLAEEGRAELSIYNLKGQKVRTLVNDHINQGEHSIVWNGKDSNNNDVSSGVYFYKLKTEKHSETSKMLLLK